MYSRFCISLPLRISFTCRVLYWPKFCCYFRQFRKLVFIYIPHSDSLKLGNALEVLLLFLRCQNGQAFENATGAETLSAKHEKKHKKRQIFTQNFTESFCVSKKWRWVCEARESTMARFVVDFLKLLCCWFILSNLWRSNPHSFAWNFYAFSLCLYFCFHKTI